MAQNNFPSKFLNFLIDGVKKMLVDKKKIGREKRKENLLRKKKLVDRKKSDSTKYFQISKNIFRFQISKNIFDLRFWKIFSDSRFWKIFADTKKYYKFKTMFCHQYSLDSNKIAIYE